MTESGFNEICIQPSWLTCLEDGKFNVIIADKQWLGAGPLLQAALDET